MKGWLTPDSDQFSENLVERRIRLPGSLWLYVSGALQQLGEEYNWETFGTSSPEETAQFFQEAIDNYMTSQFDQVGMIAAWVRDIAMPFGWLPLTGQVISVDDYPELAAVVSPNWVVDGSINLPDARHEFLVMSGPEIGIGTQGGAATHTLTVDEMPSHNHTYETSLSELLVVTPGEAPVGFGAINTNTGNKGGSQPHNNMPPYLAIRWGIYAGR